MRIIGRKTALFQIKSHRKYFANRPSLSGKTKRSSYGQRIPQGQFVTTHGRIFDIGIPLGQGLFAEVFQVREWIRESLSIWALKLLRNEMKLRGKLKRKLSHMEIDYARRHEELIGRYIQHPHVVQIVDSGWGKIGEEERAFVLMQFISGYQLKELLFRSKNQGSLYRGFRLFNRLSPIKLINQLIDALNAVYKGGAVFGDLGPENIMIGENRNITLVDLGATINLVNPKVRGYQKRFTPPEILEDPLTNLGVWTDIYSLGGIIKFMGRFFSLPKSLDEAADSFLEKDPKNRPQSYVEALNMIHK